MPLFASAACALVVWVFFKEEIGFLNGTNRELGELVKYLSSLVGTFSALLFAFFVIIVTRPNSFAEKLFVTNLFFLNKALCYVLCCIWIFSIFAFWTCDR